MSLTGLRKVLVDVRRRRVVRAALFYIVAAWVGVEVATTLGPLLELPQWTPRLVLALALAGFPVALVLAWTYDLTEGGLERTPREPVSGAQAAAVTATSPGPTTGPAPRRAEAEAEAEDRSIAVLPFTDMSAEGDQQYLGDGIAEEILNVLAQQDELRVAARTSSFAFRGQETDVREIGGALGVATVLEGSIRKAGDRVRITAQLIDVADGYHLWSHRYDRRLDDIFAIQDEIARSIAAALELADPDVAAAGARAKTEDVRAYDYYLRGRQFFHRFNRRDIRHAIQMFEQAIETDPSYALAHAGLADAYSFLCMYWEQTDENLRRAEDASRRAVELQPELAEAHVARGLALSLAKRFDEARERFEEAIQLNSSLYEAYYLYARACWAAGDIDRAADLFGKASERRPESFDAAGLKATAHMKLGEPELAREWDTRALRAADRHIALNPDDVRALYFAAIARIRRGETEQALNLAARALAAEPGDPAVQYNVACAYALAGKLDQALDCLDRAVRLGYAHREWIENDSDLDNLREEPRYRDLLARMG